MKSVVSFVAALVLMSLAWPLRGQFGHLKGAMIPGAAAAIAVLLVARGSHWRNSFGFAVILSAIGFSLGGHFSYGKLIESVMTSQSFTEDPGKLLRLFWIGSLWGGLGLSFLGFGFSEKPIRKLDFALFLFLGFGWVVALEVLGLERYDLALFGSGLVLIHFYNLLVKQSKILGIFGLLGFLGFGISFLFVVFLLFLGHQEFFGDQWRWWALRDQIFGMLAGAWIVLATQFVLFKKLAPASFKNPEKLLWLQKLGFVFFAIYIPALNLSNVFLYWIYEKSFLQGLPLGLSLLGAAVFLFIPLLFLLRAGYAAFFQSHFSQTFFYAALFFLWALIAMGIAKETLVFGPGRWEDGFSLFLILGILFTGLLPYLANFREDR